MNLQTRVERLEQSSGTASEDCPRCAARAARVDPPRDDLWVVESWQYTVKCPQCARPFIIQVDYVERVGREALITS